MAHSVSIECLNMLDRDATSRPERRSSLIAKELAQCHINITALHETRHTDEGMLREARAVLGHIHWHMINSSEIMISQCVEAKDKQLSHPSKWLQW